MEFQQYKVKNVLLNYVYFPATTAYYFDRGFKKHFNVITAGASIDEHVIKRWSLEKMKKEIIPQDIPTPIQTSAAEVISSLPENWQPDLYLWFDTGIASPPDDLHVLNIPAACYLVDTHIFLEKHLEIASFFDFVFIAQKEYVPKFREKGMRCYWLPLGCDPEIHGKKSNEKKYDVGFVGTMGKPDSRRQKLLRKIQENFHVKIERLFHEEMAQLFSESKLVFNNCIINDLNMRIFEGMCSGSLLLTDAPINSGFDELFQNGKHLAVYDDENIVDVAQYYLTHEEEREKIARAGEREVLSKHTYEHRALEMIRIIEEEVNAIAVAKEAATLKTNKLLGELLLLKDNKEYQAIVRKYEGVCNFASCDEEREAKLIAAEAYSLCDRIQDGMALYKECLNKYPESVSAMLGLGTILLHENKKNEAREFFDRVLTLEPENSKALCGKGLLHLMGAEAAEAKECFVKSLEANIENPLAINQLVAVSSTLKDYTEAIYFLERYVALGQVDLDYCYTLASLYFLTGQREKAAEQVNKVLLLDPENENAHELLEKITISDET